MRKKYCDRCNAEIKANDAWGGLDPRGGALRTTHTSVIDLCRSCSDAFSHWLNQGNE